MFNKNFNNLSGNLIDAAANLLTEHAELDTIYRTMLEEYGVRDPMQLSEELQDEFLLLANEVLGETYMGFEKLKKAIAARGGVRDPAAVAAAIGRKKYGKERFQKMAAAGKKKPMKEASNETPTINHLELSEKKLDELSPGTLKSYVKKVASTPAGMSKPSRERGIETASKKLHSEENLSESLSQSQIAALKAAWSKINRIDPDSPNYQKLINLLDRLSKSDLERLADAGINFVSALARNRVTRTLKNLRKEETIKQEEVEMPKGMSMKERTAFHMAAAAAAKAGKSHFDFGGKKFKTTMSKVVARKMTEEKDDDEDETASKHIIMQLRKSVSLRGRKDVGFNDGSSHKVPAHVASAVLNHYNSLKTAEQKDNVQRKIAKSHDHLMKHYDSLQEGMYDPTQGGKLKTLVEKKPKKINEIPVETMKQVKMVHQEEEEEGIESDPNTGKMIHKKGRVHQEEVNEEQIDEREMTSAEKAKREKIVMAMKKKMAGFKSRYGEKAKNVMYATATKQAMKEEPVDNPKGKTMTGQKKDGVEVKPEMRTPGASGVKSTTT